MILQYKDLIRKPLLVFILLVLWGLLLYSNTFHDEFCSDDLKIIVQNNVIKDISNIQEIWAKFNTRFLTGFSFAVNYRLGGLNVFGYHLVNWLLHVLASFMVYLVVKATFTTPAMRKFSLLSQSNDMSLLAALVFLSHPMQTQAVNFITQRCVLMATFFYLGTIFFYIRARLEQKPVLYIVAILMMLPGLFSKEMTVTIPLVLTIYEIYFMRDQERPYRWPKILAVFYVLAFLVPIALYFDREGSILELKNQIAGRPFNWSYFLTEINAFRTYIRMLIFPLFQSHHYSYPIAENFWEWPTIFSMILLISVLFYAVRQFPRQRLLSFSIVWFFLALSVEMLHVCFVNKGVIYDHWLYLAMAGFGIFLTNVIYLNIGNKKTAVWVILGVIFILSILSYNRNRVWQTSITLWQDAVSKYPQDYLPYVNLGVAFCSKGYIDRAIGAYGRALDLHRNQDTKVVAQILVNLGAAYGKKGDYEKEIEFNQNAINLDPLNVQAYSNLCLAYGLLGDFDRALSYGNKALSINPAYADCYNNLGVLFANAGDFEKAGEHFQKAVYFDPDHDLAKGNLQKLRDLSQGK